MRSHRAPGYSNVVPRFFPYVMRPEVHDRTARHCRITAWGKAIERKNRRRRPTALLIAKTTVHSSCLESLLESPDQVIDTHCQQPPYAGYFVATSQSNI